MVKYLPTFLKSRKKGNAVKGELKSNRTIHKINSYAAKRFFVPLFFRFSGNISYFYSIFFARILISFLNACWIYKT